MDSFNPRSKRSIKKTKLHVCYSIDKIDFVFDWPSLGGVVLICIFVIIRMAVSE